MSRYPLRQPPAGWRIVFTTGEGWYVLRGWQPVAGPYTERWYAVARANQLAANETKVTDEQNQSREGPQAQSRAP